MARIAHFMFSLIGCISIAASVAFSAAVSLFREVMVVAFPMRFRDPVPLNASERLTVLQRSRVVAFQAQRESRTQARRHQAASAGYIGSGLIAA